ncbi:MAG: AsmA family protein [Hyphomicrobiaceae bacterium]
MNRVLLAIGGLLVGLLATLFAGPAMVDWNRYRGMLEEEATRFLGREVRVGGKVNLRLLPVPYIQFEQVRIADTQGSVGRPLFMAEDFTVWLSVGALLSGAIEAKDIELRKPTVTLVLDGKGGGNWSSLSPEHFRGSYVPARVAFDAVRITGGTLAILAPDGKATTKFENINGELSAQALEGPYRLAATFASGEQGREIRLSTAKPAEDGTVRFKGTVRDPSSGVSYSLEGDAHDVLSNIKVAGQVTARLPLPASLASKAKSGGFLGVGAAQPGGEFDMRAALEGDTKGFTLSDLSLSFEQGGRPQLATGSARVSWADQADVSVTLKSHWLDLDKISGAGTGGTALELAQGVAAAVSRILATDGRTQADLTIDQATLGGDVVSNLTAVLEHSKGKLNVKSLSAALPGGARVAASGSFEGPQTDLRYTGRVVLRGASMARFASWASHDQKLVLPTRDGPFTLGGDLSLGSKEVAGHNLTLEIGRNMLSGDASWAAGTPQQIVLNLEGSELDLTPIVPSGDDPAKALRDLIASLAGDKSDPNAAIGPADADVKLRIERLIVGSTLFQNAVAELKLVAGNLSMPQLRLASTNGYQVELRGDVTNLTRRDAKGALTGVAVAETAEGVAALARLAGLPSDLVPEGNDAAVMAPLRIAGRLTVGAKGPDTHDLSLDGTLAGSRVAGTIRLGKEQAEWRDRPVDFAMSFDGEAARRLVSKALGASAPSTAATSGLELTLRGLGDPKSGMTVLAAVDADGISGAYRGRASLGEKNALGLEGEVSVALKDLAQGLALAGIASRTGFDGPVNGTVHVARAGESMKLTSPRLRVGDSEASGELVIKTGAETTQLSGDVKLTKASLQGLFALLSAGETRAADEDGGKSPWSERALDLSTVERLAGSRVRLDVKRLAFAPGLDVDDAQVELTARAEGLDVRLNEASVLGGHGSGLLVLDKAPAGVRMSAEGGVTGAKLERIAPPAPASPTALGGLTVMLKLQSTALSPRGLVAALTGGGDVRLTHARLARWTPTAIATASEAMLALKGEMPPGAFRAQLSLALQSQGVPVGTQRLTATVADGAMRIQPMVVNVPQGRLTGRMAVDLDHLQVDGEWRVEPRDSPQTAGAPPKPELPAVVVRYAGALENLASLQPKLDMDTLEREVVVRKVEREVAELERLRKLDEQRVNAEAARQIAERLAAEQRRLDELRKQQAEDARSTVGMEPAAAQSSSAGRQQGVDATHDSASPPATIERAPLPRPASPPTSRTKAPRRDPFAPFRESSP